VHDGRHGDARCHDERLDVEAADEYPVGSAISVGFDVALVPREAKGPLGTWMTKKSKPVLGGSPATSTSMISTCPTDLIRTRPLAFGRHAFADTMLKQIFRSGWSAGGGGQASSAG